ncbi:MAG: ATP-binding protein, partial [Epsilonproteobacteria bacterium]|nr:ATP-binding protein [Campylobacterota bacterium]
LTIDIAANIILSMDRNDAIRLVDNLLSNAIKYNKIEGSLNISLKEKSLTLTDGGIGIKEQDLQGIVGRFNRANKSEGGFGIGLDIVQQVVERYGYGFNIKSVYNQGTEVEISW